MTSAIAFARRRSGDIAFAVRTRRRFFGYRADHVEKSASVVKAMLMVAYLNRPSVARRQLSGYDRSLLIPMIAHSDNATATTVDGIVGNGGLEALARRVGMTRFQAVAQPWGATQITARDQTRFFLHIDRFLSRRHRAFGMRLLRSITGSQRWGVGEVTPRGWHLYFKGGWGYGTGLLDHQVVLLTRAARAMSLAVLTMYDGSHPYGKATLRGIFARLLRGLPTGAPLYPVVRGTRYSGLVKAESPRGARARGQVSAGSINFATGPGGQQVRRLAVTLTGPGDPCAPVGEPVRFRWPTITVRPRGRFRATTTATANLRARIMGRFLRGARATGTVVEQAVGRATTPSCTFRGTWSARRA